ncbi:MAG: hypothetical protein KIC54_04435 [Clostridium sp.]|jgi:hypothetical protein|nr:hypothetical protein [Clostridium sp.]
MKTFFGGMFMNKENLRKEGILYPIKLEYYKIKDLKSKNDIFGIEVVKTEYINEEIKVEKASIDKLTNDEKIENSILDILKRNEVTPVILEDVIEDLVKC